MGRQGPHGGGEERVSGMVAAERGTGLPGGGPEAGWGWGPSELSELTL